MPELYQDLTPKERAEHIASEARALVALAEKLGVTLRIERAPLHPLAMGHSEHVVHAQPARGQKQ